MSRTLENGPADTGLVNPQVLSPGPGAVSPGQPGGPGDNPGPGIMPPVPGAPHPGDPPPEPSVPQPTTPQPPPAQPPVSPPTPPSMGGGIRGRGGRGTAVSCPPRPLLPGPAEGQRLGARPAEVPD